MKKKRICLGGTFNPIHHGHLICAQAVAESGHFDVVVLIPSAKPPHKPRHDDLASVEHRLAMCRLAVEGDPLFEVDDLELKREAPSYTLDTARQFKSRGWPKVTWLIGADMLLYLPQWHEAQTLIDEVEFVIMARPGWELDWSRLPAGFQRLKENVVEAPRIDISATDIRRRVAAGESVRYLVPSAVEQYIRQHGLYR